MDEGLDTLLFMHECRLNFTGHNILEVGPKHGLHSRYIAEREPARLTMVELSNKCSLVDEWIGELNCEYELVFGPFQTVALPENSFDMVLFAGVLYHNLDQMGMIIKCASVLKRGGLLILESSTIRTDDLRDRNVIEVHYPDPFRETPTMRFHPSKEAVRSMVRLAGFNILYEYTGNPDRINLICQKVRPVNYGYGDI